MPPALLFPRLLDYSNPVRTNAPLNRGLISWWLTLPQRMSGQRWLDLVKTRHAAFTGLTPSSATVGWAGTTRPGGLGELRFNGSTAYATVGVYPEYDFADTTFTVSCWFRATAAGYLVCRRNGVTAAPNGGWFLRLDSGGTLTARVVDGANSAAGARSTTSTTLLNGAWWHVAVVVTTDTVTIGNNEVAIYLNGVLDQGSWSSNADSPYAIPTSPLTFGALSDQQAGSFLTGSLDDMRLVGRRLPVEEIRALYLASRRRYPQELRYRAWPIVGATSATLAVGAGMLSATAARIASASRAATGSEASTTTRLASSAKARSGTVQATPIRLASSLRSGTGGAQATTTRVASSLKALVATVTTQATRQVLTNTAPARAGTIHASAARLASSVRAATGLTQAQVNVLLSEVLAATGHSAAVAARLASSPTAPAGLVHGVASRIASSTLTLLATEHGSALIQALTNLYAGAQGQQRGQASRVASSALARTGTLAAGAALVASSLLARPSVMHALAQALASSVVSAQGLAQGQGTQEGHAPMHQDVVVPGGSMGHAVPLASSLLSRPGLIHAVAQVLASSLHGGTGGISAAVSPVRSASVLTTGTMQGQGHALAHQIVTATGVVQAFASLLQSATALPAGFSQGQAFTLASSLLTRSGVLQAFALAGNAVVLERTGTATAVVQALAHATVEHVLQAQAVALFLASSPRAVLGTTQASAEVRLLVSAVVACHGGVTAQPAILGYVQYGDETHIVRPGNWRVAIQYRRHRRPRRYTYQRKRR